ncbi:NAD-dependent epimerase/dehydratase family protein [Listeria booriae]|uniref:NAD-dependent epimerase/dehydratase family protein n=1 Tax=Listeria booriae TaxID=1552123 RepID=UPI001C8C25F0|nr:NAD-dependent epimerase/dehydratase family protein [Listeria booriae]
MIIQAGSQNLESLSFVQADLMKPVGWSEAVADATHVIHVVSPTPATRPEDAEEMVKMAVDGVLHVFHAAKKSGVKRIVLTSASGAVLAGHKNHPELFTEEDWSNLEAPIDAYQQSKTRAEQEAWRKS